MSQCSGGATNNCDLTHALGVIVRGHCSLQLFGTFIQATTCLACFSTKVFSKTCMFPIKDFGEALDIGQF